MFVIFVKILGIIFLAVGILCAVGFGISSEISTTKKANYSGSVQERSGFVLGCLICVLISLILLYGA